MKRSDSIGQIAAALALQMSLDHETQRAIAEWAAAQIESARIQGVRRGLEAAAEITDLESHKPGPQGYSGDPRHADLHRHAERIRNLSPEAIAATIR